MVIGRMFWSLRDMDIGRDMLDATRAHRARALRLPLAAHVASSDPAATHVIGLAVPNLEHT